MGVLVGLVEGAIGIAVGLTVGGNFDGRTEGDGSEGELDMVAVGTVLGRPEGTNVVPIVGRAIGLLVGLNDEEAALGITDGPIDGFKVVLTVG